MKKWRNGLSWQIRLNPKTEKDLRKLDKNVQKRIFQYLNRLTTLENPHLLGKALQGDLQGLWRYRVGDYRLVCQILDNELLILVVKVGHRKNIYLD